MTITINPVHGKRDIRCFIGLPPRLYSGLDGYEPPPRIDRNLILHPAKGGFFKRGRVRYWLAQRNGQPVGRISAQIGVTAPVGVPEHTGMFGCLDAIDDAEVVSGLLAAAESWLREQGCCHAFGPFLLDMNGEPGLMIDGFEEAPMTMTPWHPPYLGGLVAAAGYDTWRDLHSWKANIETIDKVSQLARLRSSKRKRDIQIRALPRCMSRADLSLVCDLYNDAWQDNWGFVPLVRDDLLETFRWLTPYLPTSPVRIVDIDGKPVAMLMIVPNMYEVTRGLAPDPTPLDWIRLGWRTLRFRPRSGRIILLGIASHLRHNAVSAMAITLMISEMLEVKDARQPEWVEAGWVLEDNLALNKILESFGFWRNKTFRIYGRSL